MRDFNTVVINPLAPRMLGTLRQSEKTLAYSGERDRPCRAIVTTHYGGSNGAFDILTAGFSNVTVDASTEREGPQCIGIIYLRSLRPSSVLIDGPSPRCAPGRERVKAARWATIDPSQPTVLEAETLRHCSAAFKSAACGGASYIELYNVERSHNALGVQAPDMVNFAPLPQLAEAA